MTINVKRKTKTVSSKIPKLKKSVSASDPMAKMIMSHFDDELKREFATFLAEKSKVVPIRKKEKKSGRGEYNKEGKEPISFKEVTTYGNPLFSSGSRFNSAEINPDTIDVQTYSLMRRNYQLAIGLAIIKMPIISLPWIIECDDRNIQKTVEWMIKKIWKKLIKTSLMAVDYGFAQHEKVWERNNVKISEIDKKGKETVYYKGDLVYYKKIKPNHPESIRMKFDDKQNLIEIVQESNSTGAEEIMLPIRKCFLFTNDEEYGNPFGISRLKNAYTVWYYQTLLLQFMMQYFERRGTPPVVATAPPGRTQDASGAEIDNLELALRVGTSLISSSIAVLPYQPNKDGNENMWKLDSLSDDARAPMFIEALNHLEARGLRALFIPEGIVSSNEKGGSGSNSVSADLFLMIQKGLISDIEDAVSEQIIRPFIEANFPPDKQRLATIRLDQLSFERKITIKEVFVEMLRGNDTAIQMGVAPNLIPSMEQMAAILEIPLETWEDATGMTQEEFKKMIEDAKQPIPTNMEAGDKPDQDTSDPDSTVSKGKAGKVGLPIKKKKRSTAVNQEQNRRRSNPTSKRANRDRNPTSNTKEN